MKVLWVGAYRDHTGYGHAAVDSILALDAAGVTVVPRAVKFNRTQAPLPERLLELEARDACGCDVVVQHSLPHTFEYNGRFRRNIGYFFSEASDYTSSDWPRYCDLMDEVWVTCEDNRSAALNSGVTVPLAKVPCAADTSRYEREYAPHKIREDLGDSFVFYSIGEGTRRKNFAAVVQAFHLEFDPAEPVELVIKSGLPGQSPEESKRQLRSDFEILKRGLNLYGAEHYKAEHVITDHLSEESMMRLHASCDCYVGPSYGEGWGIPAFDAMSLGKTPILSAFGAHTEYLTEDEGWLVKGMEVPVMGMEKSHGDLYTGRQTWFSASVTDLRRCMRQAYDNRALREKKAVNGVARAYDFGYEAVGKIMKGVLET